MKIMNFKELKKKIKEKFGVYEVGEKYIVNLKDIIIPSEFEETPPKFKKMNRKWAYFLKNGIFESKIKIDKNFVLRDGYTSYIISQKEKLDKVPVYFVD